MVSCIRESFVLQRKLFLCSRISSLKFFSSLSPVYDKISSSNSNSHQYAFKNLNEPKWAQCRYSSTVGSQSFFDLIGEGSDLNIATKQLLIEIHDFTGLPWWGTIMSTAVAMKLLISLPCGVCQQHIGSKLELTKTELNAAAESIKNKVLLQAQRGKWTPQKIKSELNYEMRKQWKILVVKNNCHPFKNFILFLMQFPVWLLMTISIRSFANNIMQKNMENPVAELQFLVGGPFWCSNLAIPDPFYILPTINAVAMLLCGEINYLHADLKRKDIKRSFLLSKIIPNFMRLLSVVFFFVSSASPSGISLFWATSSFLALAQNLFLLSPRVRRLFRIPANPSDLSKPYIQLWLAFLEKQKFFSRK